MSTPLELVTHVIEDAGFEVIQVKTLGRTIIRTWIDREPGGVNVSDCTALSRAVRGAFEDAELDPGEFEIEINSPGLDRPLTRDKDFTRFAGEKVAVRLKEKRETRKNFKGTLLGLEEGEVAVRGPDEEWRFARDEIAEVRLIPNLPAFTDESDPAARTRKPRKSRKRGPKNRR